MKILKKILIGLLIFIALLLIVALFIPTSYTVSVSGTINKPKQEVYDYAKMIRNQEHYSEWVLADPNIQMAYTGTDGTVGFTAAWNSKDDNVGEGSQTITAMTDEKINLDLHFVRPFEDDHKAAMIIKPISDSQTEFTSEFYGQESYPMNIMTLVFKPMLRNAQEKNIANLKAILEK